MPIRYGLDGEGLPPLTFAGLRYGLATIVPVASLIFREALRTEAQEQAGPAVREDVRERE